MGDTWIENTNGVVDDAMLWACVAFVVWMFTSTRVCVGVFLEVGVQVGVLRVVGVQVQPAPCKAGSGTRRGRNANGNGHCAAERRRQTTMRPSRPAARREVVIHNPEPTPLPSSPQHQQNHHQHHQTQPPPPPYSFTSIPPQTPPSDSKSLIPDLVPLYESIISSDAQTIAVQQQTLASQQDVIRAQAQMIQKLRHVLEGQDARIQELEEEGRGMRWRAGGDQMRGRSA